ncbi:hypothetical protein [Kutzneria albida]|uniref:hypothetical protein n=1 Tax=Kutzneria albida TaxID=43357 RepID=UPI00191C42E7|nr:hypothetical protein [Kutzneria albida]
MSTPLSALTSSVVGVAAVTVNEATKQAREANAAEDSAARARASALEAQSFAADAYASAARARASAEAAMRDAQEAAAAAREATETAAKPQREEEQRDRQQNPPPGTADNDIRSAEYENSTLVVFAVECYLADYRLAARRLLWAGKPDGVMEGIGKRGHASRRPQDGLFQCVGS